MANLLLLNEGRSTFDLERGFVIMQAALIKTILAILPEDSVPQYAVIFLLLQGTGPLSRAATFKLGSAHTLCIHGGFLRGTQSF